MGGVVGYIKTLQRIIEELQPQNVYVVWEGGGSMRRRSLYKDYKKGSKPKLLNRFYDQEDVPDNDDNKMRQIAMLLQLLKHTPLQQLYVQDCEADDVIAYLSRGPLGAHEKVIVSSDRDLYQLLLDDSTRIYNLHKKIYTTHGDVLKEFRVTTKNFALAKALCGDSSDNIPGIKGLGYKTVAKYFPMLGTDADIILQDVLNYASSHYDESAIYRKVVEGTENLKRNWKLIYLDISSISHNQIQKIETQLNKEKNGPDLRGFIGLQLQHGINDIDAHALFTRFGSLA